MYEFIINPRSGRRVQITGKLGRSILNNYIKQLKQFVQRGGGAGWDASGHGRWKQGGTDAYGADEADFLNFLGVRVNLETDTNKVPATIFKVWRRGWCVWRGEKTSE